jgi:hypothetical protein
MIEVKTFSQLGNNLFQYAFARILAEELGYALKVRMSRRPQYQRNNEHLTELMRRFSDAPLEIEGRRFEAPVEHYSVFETPDFDGYNLDVAAVISSPAQRRIVLEGYFEKYVYFKPYKDRIRQWFRLQPRTFGHPVSDQDILVHIRRGDFRKHGRTLKLSFYDGVLNSLRWNQLYICSNAVDDEVQDHFQRFDPIYVSQSPTDDFCFFQAFRRIVQANSTFSWWAGFLSNAEEIYAPLEAPNPYITLKYPEIDITVDDEPRYHYIKNAAVEYSGVPFSTKLRFWVFQALGRQKYDAVRNLRRRKPAVPSRVTTA